MNSPSELPLPIGVESRADVWGTSDPNPLLGTGPDLELSADRCSRDFTLSTFAPPPVEIAALDYDNEISQRISLCDRLLEKVAALKRAAGIAACVIFVLFVAAAPAQSTDYKRFEIWFARVRKEAPRYGLHLLPGDEEFFYLYCWQSDDHSIVHAIRKAKAVWSQSK